MRFLLTFLSIFVLTTCQTLSDGNVDSLYVNGVIWTGQPDTPVAKVMAIDKGKIVFVGQEIPDSMKGNEVIDLDGSFTMPGFMDNHVHFLEGGAGLASLDLRGASTPAQFKNKVADYAGSQPPGRWILNGNWDHTLWGGELPHKDWIDEATRDHPVYISRIDGHMALANSVTLEIAGITKATSDPSGGLIMRDADGEPTGILKGNALNLVLAVIPPPSENELMERFSLAQEHALSLGITKVHAISGNPTNTNLFDVFQMARERGLMKIRVHVSTPIESWEKAATHKRNIGRENEQLVWGGIKGFIDGSLGARTAWMHKPFDDEPDNTGLPMNSPSFLGELMSKADYAGLELSIHAIGDRGIDTVIEIMNDIAGDDIRDRRYRIEHFQHPSTDAIQKLSQAGVIASMHPYHTIDDGRWAGNRIGPRRLATSYAFRSILDAGGILTFGSDWPVAPLNPMKGVYAAVTRRTLDGANPDGWIPEQKITVEEALTAFTATNAYAFNEDDVAGTLEVNKRADFIVLSDDPRAIAETELGDVRVLKTVIGGKVVYSSPPTK